MSANEFSRSSKAGEGDSVGMERGRWRHSVSVADLGAGAVKRKIDGLWSNVARVAPLSKQLTAVAWRKSRGGKRIMGIRFGGLKGVAQLTA